MPLTLWLCRICFEIIQKFEGTYATKRFHGLEEVFTRRIEISHTLTYTCASEFDDHMDFQKYY